MANTIVRGQMIFQDENALAANAKKVVAAGKGKSSVGATKKKGVGLGNRKALHDITNKSKLKPQASSKLKNNTEAVDFDIAKEGFLHDHSKCIEQQQKHQEDSYYESIFLHGHDHNNKEEILEYNIKEMDDENDHAWEELKELPMDEFSDLLKCSTQCRSPPVSPVHYHSSLPSSPLAWPSETVEFKLKDENALAANEKKVVAAGKGKSSLGATKKKGVDFGNRKALHDITNKSKLQPQASSKLKNNAEAVEFDIAKEGFLHDHSKCIEQQQKHQWDSYYENIFLHDNNKEEIPEYNTKEMDDEDDLTWKELKEMPEEFSGLLKCSTQWRSPPVSPTHHHSSLPSSPLTWLSETVDFKLKEEEDEDNI